MFSKSTHHNFFSAAWLSFRPCGSLVISQVRFLSTGRAQTSKRDEFMRP
jgi:hypothetical protein